MTILTRRSFFSGLAATLAAPAIVHAETPAPALKKQPSSILPGMRTFVDYRHNAVRRDGSRFQKFTDND